MSYVIYTATFKVVQSSIYSVFSSHITTKENVDISQEPVRVLGCENILQYGENSAGLDIFMSGLTEKYQRLIDSGDITPDPDQQGAVEILAVLCQSLKGYIPPKKWTFWTLLFSWRENFEMPKGVYMYGDVGRGKTMLMDMFYDHTPVRCKRRVHFHAFMQQVHEDMHRLRQASKGEGVDAALDQIADSIAGESWLLCFDEFFVDDVADAMILGRLFTALFERGVVVVATSNCAPDDLYENGLQRDRFLPFIQLLKTRLEVIEFTDGRDYRMDRFRELQVYHVPNDDSAARKADEAYEALTDGAMSQPEEMMIKGRTFYIPAAAKGTARFTFQDICGQPRSAVDYLALAQGFHTLIIEDIPKMTDDQRNEVLRFVTLIDILYENRIKLFATAEAAPDGLYSGKQHARAFARTASRLMEMQSADYLDGSH